MVSLYTGPLMWSGIGLAAFSRSALTFLLPELRRPGAIEPARP